IVVDNFDEIELIGNLLKRYNKEIDGLMRVTPCIEAKTHHYIMTGNEDSKFDFNMRNGQADEAFQLLNNHKSTRFKGLHCQIGSQIFDTDGFLLAIDILFEHISKWRSLYNYVPEVLNVGGGFGIRYTAEESPLPHHTYIEEIVASIQHHVEILRIPMPEI